MRLVWRSDTYSMQQDCLRFEWDGGGLWIGALMCMYNQRTGNLGVDR